MLRWAALAVATGSIMAWWGLVWLLLTGVGLVARRMMGSPHVESGGCL